MIVVVLGIIIIIVIISIFWEVCKVFYIYLVCKRHFTNSSKLMDVTSVHVYHHHEERHSNHICLWKIIIFVCGKQSYLSVKNYRICLWKFISEICNFILTFSESDENQDQISKLNPNLESSNLLTYGSLIESDIFRLEKKKKWKFPTFESYGFWQRRERSGKHLLNFIHFLYFSLLFIIMTIDIKTIW